MSLESKVDINRSEGLLSRIGNKIKSSLTSKILVYGFAGSLAFCHINCDSNSGGKNGIDPTKQDCSVNSDCATSYQCIDNKCVLMPENKAPIANAGSDQPLNFDAACFFSKLYDTNGLCLSGYNIKNNLNPGQKITLDGSLSSDPEGKALQYLWRQLSGPGATLPSNSIVKPEFVPYSSGDYVFGLEVSDGEKTSTEDSVIVYVRDNIAPVSKDTSWQNIGYYHLDGYQSSDPDGYIIRCSWDLYCYAGAFCGVGCYKSYSFIETTTNAPDGNFDCKYDVGTLEVNTNTCNITLTVEDNDKSTNSSTSSGI